MPIMINDNTVNRSGKRMILIKVTCKRVLNFILMHLLSLWSSLITDSICPPISLFYHIQSQNV